MVLRIKIWKNVRIHISWSYSGSDLLEKPSFHWVRARVTTSLLCPRYISCANLVLECIGYTLEWTESAAWSWLRLTQESQSRCGPGCTQLAWQDVNQSLCIGAGLEYPLTTEWWVGIAWNILLPRDLSFCRGFIGLHVISASWTHKTPSWKPYHFAKVNMEGQL